MFFFKKVKKIKLKTDIHSHLLPVDDGVKSFDESVEIIKKFISLGYEKLIITPHVMFDGFNNKTSLILEKFEELKEILKENNINIKLAVAAEYMLDEELMQRLEKNDILSFGNNYLLFETSYYQKPLDFESMIFKIKLKGFTPVMAHPERYRYLETLDDFKQIKELGVLFQSNINSFGGFYGKSVLKKAKLIAKNKMLDFLGSDCHSNRYIDFMSNVLKNNSFHKIIEGNNIKNNLI